MGLFLLPLASMHVPLGTGQLRWIVHLMVDMWGHLCNCICDPSPRTNNL